MKPNFFEILPDFFGPEKKNRSRLFFISIGKLRSPRSFVFSGLLFLGPGGGGSGVDLMTTKDWMPRWREWWSEADDDNDNNDNNDDNEEDTNDDNDDDNADNDIDDNDNDEEDTNDDNGNQGPTKGTQMVKNKEERGGGRRSQESKRLIDKKLKLKTEIDSKEVMQFCEIDIEP